MKNRNEKEKRKKKKTKANRTENGKINEVRILFLSYDSHIVNVARLADAHHRRGVLVK